MEAIDIDERVIAERDERTLKMLLVDKTTGGYLHWATDAYVSLGPQYQPECEMDPDFVRGFGFDVIRPRVTKGEEEQRHRTRDKAEVFTPAWVCNSQNNQVDAAWFGRDPGFNDETERGWITITEPIAFDDDHTWQAYVDKRVLEIACGEAPYITTRYDATTGQAIPFNERVGLLDRKLRVVCENAEGRSEWLKWARRAVEASYAYDFQGDNVLIARENVLATVEDAYDHQFAEPMPAVEARKLTNVIAWNVWQMDGYTYTVPYAERPAAWRQLSLFDDSQEEEKEPVPCLVKDWRECTGGGRPVEFRTLVRGRTP